MRRGRCASPRQMVQLLKEKALRNLLPALLRWDLTHPEEAKIVPMSVADISKKKRPVLD